MISIAYSVLSDPNKRRQYNVSGPSTAMANFEGIDISELGGFGKYFENYSFNLKPLLRPVLWSYGGLLEFFIKICCR